MYPSTWELAADRFKLEERVFHGDLGFVLLVDIDYARRLGWVRSKEFAAFVDGELIKRGICKKGYRVENEVVARGDSYTLVGICK